MQLSLHCSSLGRKGLTSRCLYMIFSSLGIHHCTFKCSHLLVILQRAFSIVPKAKQRPHYQNHIMTRASVKPFPPNHILSPASHTASSELSEPVMRKQKSVSLRKVVSCFRFHTTTINSSSNFHTPNR